MDTMYGAVGIDVSKKKLDMALLIDEKIKAKVVENCAKGHQTLIEWLGKAKVPLSALHVCMEATGVYSEPAALALHQAGLRVSVVNPACIKGFGHSENIRNKNDGIDAALIARYRSAMKPAPLNPPPLEQRQLRTWSLRAQALKDIRQQEQNRLEALDMAGWTRSLSTSSSMSTGATPKSISLKMTSTTTSTATPGSSVTPIFQDGVKSVIRTQPEQ
ncbi:Transposase [Duganella sp. CF517]|uniref:IS110 family transposase n=1 Tax=Duganella sp. CF517 TaxID=1881038 RepID=UPI0008AE4FA1|nr:transposase [Duganella sp. CF517]SEO02900.1 Transposase [Duganella sp. CF517]